MAAKHPYISSGGPIVQAVTQFRKSFPATVDASTLKKLGIASNNESYLINILKFLGLVDENSGKTEKSKVFVIHKDEDFQASFSEIVKEAYADLFGLHGDDSWALDDEGLITYFRQTDQSTEIVGKRQALTFKALSGLAGQRELSAPRATAPKTANADNGKKITPKKKAPPPVAVSQNEPKAASPLSAPTEHAFGLSVRVEINLPADGSQATYDRIFKSIKENLIDAYKS